MGRPLKRHRKRDDTSNVWKIVRWWGQGYIAMWSVFAFLLINFEIMNLLGVVDPGETTFAFRLYGLFVAIPMMLAIPFVPLLVGHLLIHAVRAWLGLTNW